MGLKGAPLIYRVVFFNLLAGIAGTAIALSFGPRSAAGFAAGLLLGVINVLWLMRIAAKGVRLDSLRAGRLVARSYYLRFAATALILAIIVSRGLLNPLPLLAGLTGSILTTLGVMIFFALEEV
ncbi:MAG: ATP synthase subunit I [Deltaproteobacteria bacterium]|nr:ATP synthase subunit I [Deltaproteobacteria bacterium]